MSATPTAASEPSPLRRYFAPQTATHDCGYRLMPLVDENWLSSYAILLVGAQEPALLIPRTDGATILRFTWLRSFHAPIIIRLTVPRRGKGHVDIIRFSGLGGYDYGEAGDRKSREVTQEEVADLLAAADPKSLVPAKPFCGPPGVDGARWLIERSDADGHHFAERQSPRNEPIKDIGMALIRLAGLEGEEIY
jgi:hypothetical protein